MRVLRVAYEKSLDENKEEIEKFREENKLWLEDYALYMAIKNENELVKLARMG